MQLRKPFSKKKILNKFDEKQVEKPIDPYRAKIKDGNEWVYGYYVYIQNSHGIFHHIFDASHFIYEIDPKTLCKFTGMISHYLDVPNNFHNKKHPPIYENDIVQVNMVNSEDNPIFTVIWDNISACFSLSGLYIPCLMDMDDYHLCDGNLKTHQMQILGNTIDNDAEELIQRWKEK